jgi:acyl carrier protein
VKDSDDIFVMGLVNSMFAMQLVEFTEKKFDIEIGPEDLSMDNFRTINAMAALVERNSGGGRGGGAEGT